MAMESMARGKLMLSQDILEAMVVTAVDMAAMVDMDMAVDTFMAEFHLY